ncbi:MAG: serine/threonine protein kinase with repeat [Deltaproteobacteria bacterium]|nr:serine/threonine protein kinase with repeat [Deltaproteobacteria bacterium]
MSRDGTDPVAQDALEELDGTELLGTTIDGRYQLECVLGRGGMGLVYRAAHLGLRRQVAVKILHPALAASGDVRSRFEREAFAAGKIDHPNCINVMDSGKLPDGSRYLAMELLDGRALGDVIQAEGQIAPGRALHILAHILRGLGHIHGAGLIHRDIKPENIFLIRNGQDEDFAKILDFGIAKGMGKTDLEEGVKLTQAGMAFGTPIYMSPEQALGNPMDGRSDLYAAAVIGYELLCGQPPFYSDDKLEVMSMHTARPVPPMRQRMIRGARAVPASIERLIIRGLTKKPSERYASAEVFLAAVEDALKTPDGGVTDVSFEPLPSATGSQPLVTDDGEVRITGSNEFVTEVASARIAEAIDDVLATPPPQRVVPQPGIAAQLQKQRIATPPRGGVGLGLPYTGPKGEPIFGLTPEQRLAHANASNIADRSLAGALEPETRRVGKSSGHKRWPIYVGIAAVAIAAGIGIAVLTLPGGGGDDSGPDPSTPAGQAYAEYKRGEPGKAIDILEANKSTTEVDPDAQLVLGHALSARFERGRALAAYGRALTLQPEIENDDEMRKNLRTMAADDDGTVVATAFDLWIRTADPEAKQALLNAAVSDKLPRRRAVVPVIEHHQLDGSVEWWRAYSLDLQQEPACPLRKEAVGKLRALGDPRAITALEQAVERRARGAPKGRYNWCLLDDAKAAIGALSALPKKP